MIILLFQSVHYVLKAESLLRSAGISLEIIPTPRDISSDCGMSIRMAKELSAAAEEILKNSGIEYRIAM